MKQTVLAFVGREAGNECSGELDSLVAVSLPSRCASPTSCSINSLLINLHRENDSAIQWSCLNSIRRVGAFYQLEGRRPERLVVAIICSI